MVPERFPFFPNEIPDELKVGRCWVCADERKIPLVAGSRRRASSTDPETWRSYGQAYWAYREHPTLYAGVGRVLVHGEGLVGIDLDNVRDPSSGQLEAWAHEILEILDSYSEVSPSGRGVKIWIRALLDRSYVKPGLEVYNGRRYFVVTGALLTQYPGRVQERQEEILQLVEREFPRPGRGASAVTGGPYDGPALNIAEVLEDLEIFTEVRDDGGIKYRIRCPWAEEHTDADESGTYVGQFESGACWYKCWHSHCHGRGWRDFKRELNRTTITVDMPGYSGPPIKVEVSR
jgi:hypothetical protein